MTDAQIRELATHGASLEMAQLESRLAYLRAEFPSITARAEKARPLVAAGTPSHPIRRRSAATRAKMAAAQRRRWAGLKKARKGAS